MAHCGRRRYEKRVKSIKDINEDENIEDVKDDTDDVVEEKQQEKRRRKLVEDQVNSSMNADADVEDIGFDAERIDDVVSAYDAVEDNEDHAEDYFYDFSGNEDNNVDPDVAQNSFSGDDDDDVSGTPPLPPPDVFTPLSSNYKKHFDDYNIVSLVKQEVANIFIAPINHVVHGAPEMFSLEGSPLTTLEAHEALNTTFAKFSLTNESREGILDLLKQLFPKASLPKDTKRLVYSKDRITNIAETNGNYYTFDCCASCHGIVFVGLYSDYQRCPICEAPRYTDDPRNRTSVMQVNYRSLTLIICDLLHTPYFYMALMTKSKWSDGENLIYDIADGPAARKHKIAMREKFNEFKSKLVNVEDVKEVSLLLSVYYDGGQLFKRRTTSAWPLMVSILSLPPPLRIARGKGLFMLSLYTDKTHTLVEKFVIEQLVNELNFLDNGIGVTVNDVHYFIQARLIVHCYDSREVESMLQIQGAGSNSGCSLCRMCKG
jgi:hypothetical protein